MAPRSAAAAADSMPRPVRLGMLAVATIAATLSAVSGSAWPRPRPAAWRVMPCSTRRVGGAAVAECLVDARPVGCAQFDRQGGGERSGGADAGSCLGRYHRL